MVLIFWRSFNQWITSANTNLTNELQLWIAALIVISVHFLKGRAVILELEHRQTVISFEYQAGLSLASAAVLSDEVKMETTQTLHGEPRPSFGPRRLSGGQGHWRNSRKNVVQALFLIPASPADLDYIWTAESDCSSPTQYPLWDWLEATTSTNCSQLPNLDRIRTAPCKVKLCSFKGESLCVFECVKTCWRQPAGVKKQRIKYRC